METATGTVDEVQFYLTIRPSACGRSRHRAPALPRREGRVRDRDLDRRGRQGPDDDADVPDAAFPPGLRRARSDPPPCDRVRGRVRLIPHSAGGPDRLPITAVPVRAVSDPSVQQAAALPRMNWGAAVFSRWSRLGNQASLGPLPSDKEAPMPLSPRPPILTIVPTCQKPHRASRNGPATSATRRNGRSGSELPSRSCPAST